MFISKEFDSKLKAAFDLYYQREYENYPPKEELEKITFSAEFEKKMQKLIAAQKKPYYYLINTVGKRVAIILLAVLITLTATTFGVKAIRETVVEFITETFEKFTRITVETDEPAQVNFEKIKPEYIPEGYYFERDSYTTETAYSIIYRDDNNKSVVYMQQITNKEGLDVDSESIKFKTIYINSFEGVIYENKGYNNLIFATEEYCFTLIGKISKEEIIKMAESIKIK